MTISYQTDFLSVAPDFLRRWLQEVFHIHAPQSGCFWDKWNYKMYGSCFGSCDFFWGFFIMVKFTYCKIKGLKCLIWWRLVLAVVQPLLLSSSIISSTVSPMPPPITISLSPYSPPSSQHL